METGIKFTQFLRPDGRTRQVSIERSAEVVAQAKLLVAVGYRFEVEELKDGTVSMTVDDDEGTVAIELCPNGPEVPDAVDRLVKAATEAYRRELGRAGRGGR